MALKRVSIFLALLLAQLAQADDEPAKWNLDDVNQIAIDNNPDLEAAKANWLAAGKAVGISLSAYIPHLSAEAQFDFTTLPNPSAGLSAQLGHPLPYGILKGSINQTVFDFGQSLARIFASSSTRDAAEQEVVSVRNAVRLAVQKAFYNVLASEKLVAVAQKGLMQYEETLRRTEVLVRTGAKPQFDLTQAKVAAAKAKLALINAQNINANARVTLLSVMGLDVQKSFELVDSGTPAEFAALVSKDMKVETLVEKALSKRPEIKRQQFTLDRTKYEYYGHLADWFPSISVQLWGGQYYPNFPNSIDNAWGVAVMGTWSVFDGFETGFRMQQKSAEITAQTARLRKDRLQVSSEVTIAFKDLSRSEENEEVAKQALSAAQENLSLAQKRYDADVATILELLIAQNALLSAEATSVTARYDHEISLATLRRVVNSPLRD